MIRLLQSLLGKRTGGPMYQPRLTRFNPEPPPGFVRRSDPNFYFLARKF